jgi:hypothetical protein
MKDRFKLVNISMNNNRPFSCEPLDSEEIFWPKSAIVPERRRALFNYKKTTGWEAKMFAIIEHEGLRTDGTPINGVVVEVEEE